MACLVDTCGWIEWLTDGVLVTAFEPWLSEFMPQHAMLMLY